MSWRRGPEVSGLPVEDPNESFLLKMAVTGEDLPNSLLPHDVHGDAVHQAVALIRAPFVQRQAGEERFVRLGDHVDAGVFEDLARQAACQAPGVIAVSGNGGQEFAQHLFGCDQRCVGDIRSTGGLGPFIAWDEDREPVKRVGENPPHRLGSPYT